MTSDAKIGLLLGLVFIIVIAFIINGFPSFDREKDNNKLTQRLTNLETSSLDIAAKIRKTARALEREEAVKSDDGVRAVMKLPGLVPSAKSNIEIAEADPSQIEQNPIDKAKVQPGSSIERIRPRVHIVQQGDNLAIIALKFYGPHHGAKKINVDRIFLTNRKILESPDRIFVGQKLIIPPLLSLQDGKTENDTSFERKSFKKVETMVRRHRSTGVSNGQIHSPREYIVQQNDSLWRIAAEQLGNGGRYPEIVQLNASIIDDEEYLLVGMHLKLPGR